MTTTKCPYQVLGVSSGADAQSIKTAYRRLAKQYHPDLHPNDRQAEERFKEIAAAYDAIINPSARSARARYSESQEYQPAIFENLLRKFNSLASITENVEVEITRAKKEFADKYSGLRNLGERWKRATARRCATDYLEQGMQLVDLSLMQMQMELMFLGISLKETARSGRQIDSNLRDQINRLDQSASSQYFIIDQCLKLIRGEQDTLPFHIVKRFHSPAELLADKLLRTLHL